ncbi:hypothetical protein [Amycolatopsis sp. TNS106]|uniref:hypothetical protein n=1 Tax=Amycolatopsis sp. TNS106 TaxID=2861750 RepID=UPI001C57CBC8|nr:hypothetical protein [Amycolatopsis sp. TNS106]
MVEILDALGEAPCPIVDMHRRLGATRRATISALRVLAVAGVIRRCDHCGSWDGRPPPFTRYELTPAGRDIVRQLDRPEVWTALYEHYLGTGPASAMRRKRKAAMWAPISIVLLFACLGNAALDHTGRAILFGTALIALVATAAYHARHRTT